MESWNGLGMMQSVATEWLPHHTFVSDASGSWAAGYFGRTDGSSVHGGIGGQRLPLH